MKKVNFWKDEQDLIALDALMMDLVDPETGEILDIEEFEKLEAEVNRRIEFKLDLVVDSVRRLKSDINAIDAELERLNARKKDKKETIERFDNMVKKFMLTTGKKKLESSLGEFKLTRSEKVEITDERKVDEKFIKVKVKETRSVDKIGIKKAIKGGEKVDGATIIENFNVKFK
jgi:uncharacterized small protein (DUF1192 family)